MEVMYTFCDNCNLDKDSNKTMLLSEEVCKGLGVPAGSVAIRGVFEGPFEAAKAIEGWQDRDFGHCCPVCATELDLVEASGDTIVGIDELRDTLAKEPEAT